MGRNSLSIPKLYLSMLGTKLNMLVNGVLSADGSISIAINFQADAAAVPAAVESKGYIRTNVFCFILM